jgi:hypothetical protein
MIRRFLALCALLALASGAPASALPGQSLADFDSWSHGITNLHGISGQSGLDGVIAYTASFSGGVSTAEFRALSDKDETKIASESILYAAPDDYRLDQHRETAARLLSAVYGEKIADDFRSAAVAAPGFGDTPTVAYRGKLYGFEATGLRITVRTLADFDLDLVCIEANDCPVGD